VRARGRDLDRDLVGGAADATRAHLERGRQDLDRLLERLDRLLAGPLGDDRERVIDNPLSGGLLTVDHHLVDDLGDDARAVDRIGRDPANLCCCTARH
jgi:hypothetical protein